MIRRDLEICSKGFHNGLPILSGLQVNIHRYDLKDLDKAVVLCNDHTADDILDGQPILNAALIAGGDAGLHTAAK